MNLKSIMRSKRSWLQKTNIKILEKPKVSIVTENKLLITRSQDMHGTMILIERGHEGSFLWWKSSIIWFHWWLDDYPGSLKFMILCISNSLVSFSVNYISMKLITFLNCFLECLPQEMMLTITRKKYSKFLFNYVPEKFVFIALPDTWLENSKYSSRQKVIHQHQNSFGSLTWFSGCILNCVTRTKCQYLFISILPQIVPGYRHVENESANLY